MTLAQHTVTPVLPAGLRYGDWIDYPLNKGGRGQGVLVGFRGSPTDPILLIKAPGDQLQTPVLASRCKPLSAADGWARVILFDDGPTPIGMLAVAGILAAALSIGAAAFAADERQCVFDPNLQGIVCPPPLPPALPPAGPPKPTAPGADAFAGAFGGKGRIL